MYLVIFHYCSIIKCPVTNQYSYAAQLPAPVLCANLTQHKLTVKEHHMSLI